MKLSRRARVAVAAAAVAAATVALDAVPSSAEAPGYSIKLAGPAKVQSGKALILTASGVDPAAAGPVYLDVIGFDAEVVTKCPGGYDEAYQLAKTGAGGVLATSITEVRDSSGHWSAQVGSPTTGTGPLLVCGYSHDTVGNTFATTTFRAMVMGAPGKK